MCSASTCSSVTISAGRGRTRAAADLRRQVAQLDQRPRGQDHAPLDGVAQLANVARPGDTAPSPSAPAPQKAEIGFAVLPGEEAKQVFGQRQDVARRARAAGAASLRSRSGGRRDLRGNGRRQLSASRLRLVAASTRTLLARVCVSPTRS